MAGPIQISLMAVAGKKLVADRPKLTTCSTGIFDVKDLPFKAMPPGDVTTTHVTHTLEIVRGITRRPDMNEACQKWASGQPVEPILHLTTGLPPHTPRYLLTVDDTDDTKWMLLRHCHYDPRGQVKRISLHASSDVLILEPLALGSPRLVSPVIHYMMSNINGEFLSRHALVRGGRASANPSADNVKEGFAYIRLSNGSSSNAMTQAPRYLDGESPWSRRRLGTFVTVVVWPRLWRTTPSPLPTSRTG